MSDLVQIANELTRQITCILYLINSLTRQLRKITVSDARSWLPTVSQLHR